MKKLIIISVFLLILTIGSVSASNNDSATNMIEDENPIAMQENITQTESEERLNVSYEITVDEEYLEDSRFESTFDIEMYDREFLNGNLEIYIDGDLKFSCNPKLDHNNNYEWESEEYMNSYSILDCNFLERLDLTYGQHKADFIYAGDPLFNDFNESRIFNYTYIRFYVPEDENEYESTCRICVESFVAEGWLKIMLDNKTIHNEEFDGYEYIELKDLTFGRHTYDIYYTGTGSFKSMNKHGTFNRTYKFNAYFNYYDDNKLEIGEIDNLTINLPYDASSNVTVALNNETYSSALDYGTAIIRLTNLKIGENIIRITYNDDKYCEKTIILNKTVIPSFYFPYACDDIYSTDAKITLIMSNDAKGTLKLKIDGKEFLISDLINGSTSVPLNKSIIGNHDFEIEYAGDYEEYFKKRTYENITVSEESLPQFELDAQEMMIHVELPEGENATLTITINGKAEAIAVNTTSINYPLNLKEGLWDINVTYTGENINKSERFHLDTMTKYFDLECEEFFMKDSDKQAYLNTYDEDIIKRIEIFIDNKKTKAYEEYTYCSYAIDFDKLSKGTHTLKVNYKNKKNTIVQSITKKFTIVDYSNPKIQLADVNSQELNVEKKSYYYPDPYDIYLSDNTTLIMNLDLAGNINGKVTVYITDINWQSRYFGEYDENIIGIYNRFDLKSGKAKIIIPTKIFNRTYDFKLAIELKDRNSFNRSFEIFWMPKVEHPPEIKYNDNETLAIHIPEANNTLIGMFGNFKPVYSKIINGTAKFPLSTLPVANGITVTFVYNGYDNNEGEWMQRADEYNLKINIKGFTPKLIGDKKAIIMYYGDTATYSLKVSGVYGKIVGKGETVTFKIGKSTFNIKTDKNGIATLKIPNKITSGKYTITAAYNGVKTSAKLTVKPVLSIKTVNIKKSAKKLTLQATLKKGKTPLKNNYITFKFNGKTYKAKTNSKGIAKVTIKSQVLKKLKAGKTVTYQATYLKDTVKKTAKVKK